ncbi:nucleolar and spindle-associated protein 1 [Pungitius pungitius]|uniref:nucleolar and spindle-associated protein 1 n=1 Tax=Pungitius pungitius TaxID=134920 RepID=UPI002E1319A0
MDLDSMKYAELRSLAKELGLKANMKADKLLKAIKQHYHRENHKQEEGQVQENNVTTDQEDETASQDSAQADKDASGQEGDVSSSAVFVNTRRGKRNGTKRKICTAATRADASSPPMATQAVAEVAESSPPCSATDAKKRKVSSTKDSVKGEAEPPEEPQATGSVQQLVIEVEAPVQSGAEKASTVPKGGKIPRYQGQQKNKASLKPVTPNFKKLHEAHFNKMESIDTYVQRKTKQLETTKSSVKKTKRLSAKSKPQLVEGKAQVKASGSRASLFSPVSVDKRPAEDRRTLPSAGKAPSNKPPGKEDAPFRPSVLSTRRINVRFSEATRDNDNKKSLVKTPARMSLCVTSSTPNKPATNEGKPKSSKTSTFSATKTAGAFFFIGNTSTSTTPGTQKKSGFDLKASLSRPLTYKPHAGKLKAFGENQENTAANKSLISNSHQKNYKQHQVQTRGERRAKHVEGRKQKKESILGARRGLVLM